MAKVGGSRMVVAGLLAAGFLAACGGSDASSEASGSPSTASTVAAPTSQSTSTSTSVASATPPVWPAPQDALAAAEKAGLPMLSGEMLAVHYHAHLDIRVNGAAVAVPANIGIAVKEKRISPLHTHDGTGIVHIESATPERFTLGQLFDEWNVALSNTGIGELTADATHSVRVFVNGQPATGAYRDLVLAAHQQIAVVYGDPAASVDVPTSYSFPAGL